MTEPFVPEILIPDPKPANLFIRSQIPNPLVSLACIEIGGVCFPTVYRYVFAYSFDRASVAIRAGISTPYKSDSSKSSSIVSITFPIE